MIPEHPMRRFARENPEAMRQHMNQVRAHRKPATKKEPMAQIETISGGNGQKPIKFRKGGLHQSVGVPQGQKIPAEKLQAALAGKYGPKAKEQAQFYENVLKRTGK